MKPTVVVVGSLNMDLVVGTSRQPRMGETILGNSFATFPGGKGANQAVAAARLGAEVYMIGQTGADSFGQALRENLAANQVDCSGIKVNPEVSTGVAQITVDQTGMNSIIVVPGANAALSILDIEEMRPIITSASLVLLQHEIPLETVWHTIRLARSQSIPVVLNPAPVASIPPDILDGLDTIIPNETELSQMTGLPTTDYPEIVIACQKLIQQGVRRVILTRGVQGCYYLDSDSEILLPAFPVRSVDSTAAGDAFIGGFAAAMVAGVDSLLALQQATAAGALAVTKPGAQTSLPTRQELDDFLKTIQ